MRSYVEQHIDAFKQSYQRMLRTPAVNFMSLLLVVLALSLPAFLFVLVDNLSTLTNNWQKGTQMTLYLEKDIADEKIKHVMAYLKAQPEISEIHYISPANGLKSFHQQFQLDMIDQLHTNPLPGVIIVKPFLNDVERTSELAARLKQSDLINAVQYDEQWVMRLKSMLETGKRLWLILAILLSIGIVVTVINAVHNAAARYQQEIVIQRLVGATKAYIQRPFHYAGMIIGTISGLLTWLSVYGLVAWLNPKITALAKLYGSDFQLHELNGQALIFLLLISVTLCGLGAHIACRRFINKV